MARRPPPLSTLRPFEAAARLESFSRAAEELHLTHGLGGGAAETLEDKAAVAEPRRRSGERATIRAQLEPRRKVRRRHVAEREVLSADLVIGIGTDLAGSRVMTPAADQTIVYQSNPNAGTYWVQRSGTIGLAGTTVTFDDTYGPPTPDSWNLTLIEIRKP